MIEVAMVFILVELAVGNMDWMVPRMVDLG